MAKQPIEGTRSNMFWRSPDSLIILGYDEHAASQLLAALGQDERPLGQVHVLREIAEAWNGSLTALADRIADAERRVAERDAAGYETPAVALHHLAHARTEMRQQIFPDRQKDGRLNEIVCDLDRFDELLRAQHAADVGPIEDEESL